MAEDWPLSEKNAVYHERNQLVALLARLYPSGVKSTEIEGWDPEWHGCVYIDLPTGQASWHYHSSEAHLFEDLPPYAGTWDGHTTDEKYMRVKFLRTDIDRSQAVAKGALLGSVFATLSTIYKWKGEGPEPAHWYAPDGTKVYRSYSDYCDD